MQAYKQQRDFVSPLQGVVSSPYCYLTSKQIINRVDGETIVMDERCYPAINKSTAVQW